MGQPTGLLAQVTDASCHFHGSKPAAATTVIQCATQEREKLVEGGKLEKSWQAVSKVDKLEQIDGKRSKEWKLSFKALSKFRGRDPDVRLGRAGESPARRTSATEARAWARPCRPCSAAT